MKKKDLRENIRNGRSTMILAISAYLISVVTIAKFIGGIVHKALSVWPSNDLSLIYLDVLVVFFASSIAMILFDTLVFLILDMKRYNLNEIERKKAKGSDKFYSELIAGIKIYGVVMLLMICGSYPVFAVVERNMFDKISYWIITATVIIALIAVTCMSRKSLKDKRKWKILGKKVGELIICAFIVYILTIAPLTSRASEINIDFCDDGKVIICNSTIEELNQIDIFIFNGDKDAVYSEVIMKDQLLTGIEKVFISEDELLRGERIDGYSKHWKFIFYIPEDIKLSDECEMIIYVYEENGTVGFSNMFEVVDGEYVFAVDNFETTY